MSKGDCLLTLVLAVAGALLGFGLYGTAQAVATGAAIGLLALPALVLVLAVSSRF